MLVLFAVQFVSGPCFSESWRSYLFLPLSHLPEASVAAIVLLGTPHRLVRMEKISKDILTVTA